MQRTPHLVGQIGYIREVPVHPATWFKVTLSDGSVATFRPSALRLSSQPEEEMVENSPYRPLPSLRTMKVSDEKSSHIQHPFNSLYSVVIDRAFAYYNTFSSMMSINDFPRYYS